VADNSVYVKVVKLIQTRKNYLENKEELLPQIEEIVIETDLAKQINDAAAASMGSDINEIDLFNVKFFCDKVNDLIKYRAELHSYLRDKMKKLAPNVSVLVGDIVAARLISHAGSLSNLAKYPASTIQILGAEKALFRALKTRGKTPKYGLLYHSTFIGKAAAKNKGKISRYLANKLAVCSRIDFFSADVNFIDLMIFFIFIFLYRDLMTTEMNSRTRLRRDLSSLPLVSSLERTSMS
jgi:nucleolar protein 56